MNSIGNDNYRPNMVPPEPIKSRAGWLSSNMAQLMVFLNGLILTVTAYATLSVFIQEVVRDDFLKTTNEIQEYIAASYGDIEKTLSMTHAFFDVLPENQKPFLIQYAKKEITGLKDFEGLYWARIVNGRRQLIPVLDNSALGKNWQKRLANYNVDPAIKEKFYIIDEGVLPHISADHQKGIVGVVQRSRHDANGYMIGLVDVRKILLSGWMQKRPNIQNLELMNSDSSSILYSYAKETDANKSMKYYTSISKVPFVNKTYDLKVDLVISPRELFLQKIPLLMLLFGVTLTLIGTLYVRNNQAQSKKLSSMNKKLAHKNYALSQEMSERERLNITIQQSAKENKAIINAVSDIIFEIKNEGTIVFLNDAWTKVTGFELERSMGRNMFDLMYPADQEEHKNRFQQLVKGQKSSYRAFTKIRCSNGNYRTVEIAVSMLRQDENKDLRAVGTITDVEERRRAEQALGEAEKKYRAIVENAASGIYQVTPEGQFLSANPAFAKIMGYDTAEEILRDISNAQKQLYVENEEREKILKDVAQLKIPKSYEAQVKRKDGDVVWVRENIRPVHDDEGTILFYEGSMEDIDQRKKAEIALKVAITKSDLANRAKSEFLANMSHELRTPLNSIIGFAEIIKNEAFGEIEQEEYTSYAGDIFSSGSRLLNVINEILDVSQIETGERDLKEGIVSIKEITESCVDMMRGKAQSKHIRIDNKISEITASVIGEKHAIKQMLLNLLSNAIRFSPDNSYIMMDAELDVEGRMQLSITDTGVGLTEGELEKALSPFGQLETEHSREKSGTGLGLTLVKSLIELHGGALEIVSQKNIGTTATLIFPQKRVTESKKKTETPQEKSQSEKVKT